MGAEPWDYFVPYENDIQAALDKLRQREFRAGRYRGSEDHPANRTLESAKPERHVHPGRVSGSLPGAQRNGQK